MKAQDRRKIYVSSLEAHVDALHAQLLERKLYPVSFERLEKIHGLRSKTVVVSECFGLACEARVADRLPISASIQSMIGGIGHDVQKIKVRLEELHRDVSPSRKGEAVRPVANPYWHLRTTIVVSDSKRGSDEHLSLSLYSFFLLFSFFFGWASAT